MQNNNTLVNNTAEYRQFDASNVNIRQCVTAFRLLVFRHLFMVVYIFSRLYDRLEEVKRQKELKSRQEACAKNRLKAKEFHKVNSCFTRIDPVNLH